jgi:hypothetical protein
LELEEQDLHHAVLKVLQVQIQFLQIHHHQLHQMVEAVEVVVHLHQEQMVVQVEEEEQI